MIREGEALNSLSLESLRNLLDFIKKFLHEKGFETLKKVQENLVGMFSFHKS